MIKIEDTEISSMVRPVYSARNAMNSWDNSDSYWGVDTLGKADLSLAKRLVKAGSDHSKFMRMIVVWVDITAPLYFWKEFDTYKVGTVANSCSTMHKLTSKEITEEDFSIEEGMLHCFIDTIVECERLREEYLATGDKTVWKTLIELLPSGYMQKRTVMLNYAVLRNMYFARKGHKLDEWHDFCKWIESLPYSELITMEE